jgi:hypothetical protein
MTATGRLLFLLVVTGLFVRIWTEDAHATQERRLARVRARQSLSVAHRLPESLPQPLFNVTAISPAAKRPIDAVPPAAWSLSTCPLAAPMGITAGTYRVVDNAGQVGLLEVTTDDLAFHSFPADLQPLDCYTMSSGSARWFFIRLQSASTELTAPVATPIEPPVVIGTLPDHERRRFNHKFDFTGYQ